MQIWRHFCTFLWGNFYIFVIFCLLSRTLPRRLTGFLLCSNPFFLQVIEGIPSEITAQTATQRGLPRGQRDFCWVPTPGSAGSIFKTAHPQEIVAQLWFEGLKSNYHES